MDFNPKPYEFRFEHKDSELTNLTPDDCLRHGVKFPDFHIWFDHTLAVLWLCSQHKSHNNNNYINNNFLTEVHLQWAIQMLKSLQTCQGNDSTSSNTNRIDSDIIPNAIRYMEQVESEIGEKKKIKNNRPKSSNSLPAMATTKKANSTLSSLSGLMASSAVQRGQFSTISRPNFKNVVSRFCPEKLEYLLGNVEEK